MAIARIAYGDAVKERDFRNRQIEQLDGLESEFLNSGNALTALRESLWGSHEIPGEQILAILTERCLLAQSKRGILGWIRKRVAGKKLRSLGSATPSLGLSSRVVELHTALRTHGEQLGEANVALKAADEAVGAAGKMLVERVVEKGYVRSSGSHSIETSREQGPITANVRDSMSRLKGWACTNLSTRQSLPLTAGLFDVVIIDEASQCTIASALAIMYRAKQVIFIGDPNQLSPITKLSNTAHSAIAARQGFTTDDLYRQYRSYADWSIWHYAQQVLTPGKTQFLDLHFRCHPSIARWFNTMFYNDQLTIVTALGSTGSDKRGLIWEACDGLSKRSENRTCFNPIQAKAAAKLVQDLAADDDVSIGVVTPFTAQAAEIEKELRLLGLEGRAKVATAHKFQGDECDHIIFSTTVDPLSVPRTLEWVESNKNLLNVAASRARRSLIVLGHPGIVDLRKVPTLASLASAAKNGLQPSEQETNIHSLFEDLIVRGLHEAHIPFLLKPVEDGYELDIAVLRGSRKFDIEVDGIHHLDGSGNSRRRDIARDQALASYGWTVIRIPTWRIATDPASVITELVETLSSDG
jgi:AAA domain/Protein of unknown function (DUF559)